MGHLLGGHTVKWGVGKLTILLISCSCFLQQRVTVRFAENTSLLVFMQNSLTDSRTWPDAASGTIINTDSARHSSACHFRWSNPNPNPACVWIPLNTPQNLLGLQVNGHRTSGVPWCLVPFCMNKCIYIYT